MNGIEKAIEKAILARKHGAVITESFALARKQAKTAVEKGLTPFPVVVKDCFTVKDSPTTCASMMLEKFVPPYTATVVNRLVDNGGCIIGKANLDEFSMGTSSALGHFGAVKSGLTSDVEQDWHIPGGSSGGPAVAVQLGIADMGLASDTGGSTRNPAAFNGLFGLKPTYGVLSRHGLIPLVNSLDAPSILARSATDCLKYLRYMSGVDSRDATSIRGSDAAPEKSSLKGLRIGIPKEYHNEWLSEDAWRVWNQAASVLQREGAILSQILLPSTRYALDCYHVLSTTDIASNMARYDGVAYGHRSENGVSTVDLYTNSRTESLNNVVRKRIMAGNYFMMKRHRLLYVEQATKVRRLITDEILNAFSQVDILLTPVAAGPAPLFSQLQSGDFRREDHDDFYTQPANLAGVPAISVPFGESASGLPVGIQLMGNRLDDQLICEVAQLMWNVRHRK